MVCLDVAGATSSLVDEEETAMRQGSCDITREANCISSSMLWRRVDGATCEIVDPRQ